MESNEWPEGPEPGVREPEEVIPENDPGAEPEWDEDKENGVHEAEPSTPDPDIVVTVEDEESGDLTAVPI